MATTEFEEDALDKALRIAEVPGPAVKKYSVEEAMKVPEADSLTLEQIKVELSNANQIMQKIKDVFKIEIAEFDAWLDPNIQPSVKRGTSAPTLVIAFLAHVERKLRWLEETVAVKPKRGTGELWDKVYENIPKKILRAAERRRDSIEWVPYPFKQGYWVSATGELYVGNGGNGREEYDRFKNDGPWFEIPEPSVVTEGWNRAQAVSEEFSAYKTRISEQAREVFELD